MTRYRPLLLIAAALAVFAVVGNLLVRGGLQRILTTGQARETKVTITAEGGGILNVTVVSTSDPVMAPTVLLFALPADPATHVLAGALVDRGFIVAIAEARTAAGLKSDESLANRWVSDLTTIGQWLDGISGSDPARRVLIGVRAGAPAVLAAKVAESTFTAAALLFPVIPDPESTIGKLARRGTPGGVLRVERPGDEFPEDVDRELAEPTKRLQASETTLAELAANSPLMDQIAEWLKNPHVEQP